MRKRKIFRQQTITRKRTPRERQHRLRFGKPDLLDRVGRQKNRVGRFQLDIRNRLKRFAADGRIFRTKLDRCRVIENNFVERKNELRFAV